jgi:hypothetical protein
MSKIERKKRGRPRIERWNSRAINWPCKDCGCEVAPVIDGKRYTWGVHDAVWAAAGMRPQGGTPLGCGEFLCIDHLSKRLGRDLAFTDFTYSTSMVVGRKTWEKWSRSYRVNTRRTSQGDRGSQYQKHPHQTCG